MHSFFIKLSPYLTGWFYFQFILLIYVPNTKLIGLCEFWTSLPNKFKRVVCNSYLIVLPPKLNFCLFINRGKTVLLQYLSWAQKKLSRNCYHYPYYCLKTLSLLKIVLCGWGNWGKTGMKWILTTSIMKIEMNSYFLILFVLYSPAFNLIVVFICLAKKLSLKDNHFFYWNSYLVKICFYCYYFL